MLLLLALLVLFVSMSFGNGVIISSLLKITEFIGQYGEFDLGCVSFFGCVLLAATLDK